MQHLPNNMHLGGRNRLYDTGKSPYQITYSPKNQRPFSNGDNQGLEQDSLEGTWYPSCRPLKQWRKRGTTTSLPTNVSEDPCCLDSQVGVGSSFKMLGKNEYGKNDCKGCDPTRGPSANGRPTKGTVINFNGSSNIISASTIVPKTYYQSFHSYLRARGNSFVNKSVVHKIPNVRYTENGEIVWPEQSQNVPNVSIPIDSSYYYGNYLPCNVPDSKNCNLAIYKPSNSQFAVQGAVDSSTRIQRLQYNAITKNNQSFYQNSNQGVNIMYQPNPVFFSKNKFSPQKRIKTGCGNI